MTDYSALREGLCPEHGTPLERREDCGWCEQCNTGWSLTATTVTQHFPDGTFNTPWPGGEIHDAKVSWPLYADADPPT